LAEVQADLANLPDGDLTESGRTKLSRFEEVFVEQLRAYGLSSISPDSLSISPESYKPIHAGFDIEFNNSASDLIRTIWAYMVGLLETGRRFNVMHPGLLMLDEPRQQSAAKESFGTLLRRLSNTAATGQQAVVATSEDLNSLAALIATAPYAITVLDFSGKIIQPLGRP
jgi:hypothetical protein